VPFVHRITDPCFLHCLEQLIYNTINEPEPACKCHRVTIAAVLATDYHYYYYYYYYYDYYFYYYYYVYKGLTIHETGGRGKVCLLVVSSYMYILHMNRLSLI
jgi:hypothetical protein